MGDEEQVEEATYRQAAQAERSRRQWLFLFVLVAISLWLQWLGPGAMAEMRSEDGSESVLALHLLPLVALALALFWRHPAGRLTLFPVCFIPGLAMLPDIERAALMSPPSLILGLATALLYLVVAAARPPEVTYGTPRQRVAKAAKIADSWAPAFRRFVVTRAVVMSLIFGLITYGLFWDPAVAQTLAAVDGELGPRTQHSFVAVVMYFAWMVATYIGAVLPALNWEYHRRRRLTLAQVVGGRQKVRRHLWIWLAALMVVTTVVMMAGYWTG